jgi:single stranded DNA-binding protein
MKRFHNQRDKEGPESNQAPPTFLGGNMQDKGRIVLTGEVSDTPVIRATLQGLYTATFSLTSTTRRMNRSGVYTDRQKHHNIVARGDLALTIRHKIRKGNEINVEGKYHLKQWEEKSSGETKYLTQVVIDRFSFAEPDQLELPMAA